MKITDFGLAKLLDYNEGEYTSAGGKVSIVDVCVTTTDSLNLNTLAIGTSYLRHI